MHKILQSIKSSLIVSCQAPVNSPLHDAEIIAIMAKSCVNQGAKGVRIDSPNHIKAVRNLMPEIPIIGLWKQTNLNSEVYITPRFEDAVLVSEAGADIIAIDATNRVRPNNEKMSEIITKIHQELGKLVMADIDTIENAIAAYEAGADLIGTTLYGYTKETKFMPPPAFDVLMSLKEIIDVPLVCEGGISTPKQAKEALILGAFCVVVGTAITGIDLKTQEFQSVFNEVEN